MNIKYFVCRFFQLKKIISRNNNNHNSDENDNNFDYIDYHNAGRIREGGVHRHKVHYTVHSPIITLNLNQTVLHSP